MNTWITSTFLVIVSNATVNTDKQIPFQVPTFKSVTYIPRSGTVDSYGKLGFNFFVELLPNHSPQHLYAPFYTPTSNS